MKKFNSIILYIVIGFILGISTKALVSEIRSALTPQDLKMIGTMKEEIYSRVNYLAGVNQDRFEELDSRLTKLEKRKVR